MVTVTDLKQYIYCPRIVYYHHCLPAIRPETEKMVLGREEGAAEEVRQLRRSLRPYGLRSGECHVDVALVSERRQLSGRVDLVISTTDNPAGTAELIPVDFKLSPGRMGDNLRLQLAAYGLLLEEQWGQASLRGYIYFIPTRRAVRVDFTPDLRRRVEAALVAIHEIVVREAMPAAPVGRARRRCATCEFRLFCNDV
jgi:CRISPR-associated exonuclease Cas4